MFMCKATIQGDEGDYLKWCKGGTFAFINTENHKYESNACEKYIDLRIHSIGPEGYITIYSTIHER